MLVDTHGMNMVTKCNKLGGRNIGERIIGHDRRNKKKKKSIYGDRARSKTNTIMESIMINDSKYVRWTKSTTKSSLHVQRYEITCFKKH